MTDIDTQPARGWPPDKAASVATLARLLLMIHPADSQKALDRASEVASALPEHEARAVLGVALEYLTALGHRAFGGPESVQRWLEVMQMQALADMTPKEAS